MKPQQKELVEELNKHRVEVSKLRNMLNELDREKESWFKKKEEFSKKIKDSIQKVKENKAKRDSLTQEVKELKPKRNSINEVVSSKLKELDILKKEKISIAKSLNIKEPYSKIKQQIEKLEFKLETEPMPFDKEQFLMKRIKELKRLHDAASVLYESNKKMKNASDEIKKMRNEANEAHKLVQEKAKQSQMLHEEILKISAEIDRMKVEEEDAFKKFSEYKKQFTEANNNLKERLKGMSEVKSQLDKIHFDRKEKRRQEEESFLKSKEEEVNQKIKRGEKLTTEDLLVFQKFGERIN